MPIPFSCGQCGRKLRVKDELAGKQIYCPDCKSMLSVPYADQGATAVQESPAEALPAESADRNSLPDDASQAPVRQARPRDGGWDTEPPPQKQKPTGGGFGSINAGMGGGIAMMAVAAIWFVLGWWAGRIFIYPPILFVVGLVAFIRALSGRE